MPSVCAQQARSIQPESAMVDQTEIILSDIPPFDTNNLSTQSEAKPQEPKPPTSEI
jgi:hypothetical protein